MLEKFKTLDKKHLQKIVGGVGDNAKVNSGAFRFAILYNPTAPVIDDVN